MMFGKLSQPVLFCKQMLFHKTYFFCFFGRAILLHHKSCLFCGQRPLPFGGSHLRLPSGPAGIRTTTGSLSALARPVLSASVTIVAVEWVVFLQGVLPPNPLFCFCCSTGPVMGVFCRCCCNIITVQTFSFQYLLEVAVRLMHRSVHWTAMMPVAQVGCSLFPQNI